ATAGHARRGGGLCRPRGCLASGTSGGGGRLDAPGGTRAGRRGVGAWRDAGREPSRSDRAGLTCGEGTAHWPASPQANEPGGGAWKKEHREEKSAPKQIRE